MESNNLNYQRRCAVSKAWSKERSQVLQSRGSRNWSQKEQREIIVTGKCHGYEGQHMLSVKSHPEHAGNEKNIQFLTHEEHFRAHGGNWKNDANGRYNLRTQKVDSFEGELPTITYRKLSAPLSDRAKKIAKTKYEKSKIHSKSQFDDEKLNVQKQEQASAKKISVNGDIDKKADSRILFNRKANNGSKKRSVNSITLQNRSSGSKGNGNSIGY